TGRVQDHAAGGARRLAADRVDALDFHDRRWIEFLRKHAPAGEEQDYHGSDHDQTCSPVRSPGRTAALAPVDLQAFEFGFHCDQTSRKAVRISFREAERAGRRPPSVPSATAKIMPVNMICGVT